MSTIYKKDSSNRTRVINYWTEGNTYYSEAGLIDGNLVKNFKVCEGKNIGKINQSSDSEQAILEMEAEIKKKLKGEYFENIDDIDSKEFRPQKGLVWQDQKVKPKYPLIGSYKLDGARCYAELINNEVVLKSFTGELWVSCPHINKELLPILQAHPNLIIDGELYNMSYAGRFNELMSLVRQQKPTIEDYKRSEEVVELHVYDLFDKDDPNMLGIDRINVLLDLRLKEDYKFIKFSKQKLITSDENFDAFHKEAIDLGCEGTVVRTNIAYTPNKKGKAFFKRKDYQDAEFELIDFLEGEGNWSGKAKRAIVKMPNGLNCGVGVIGTYEECEKYLVNKANYIGKLATVKYLCFTPDGLLREGILKDVGRTD